MLPFNEITTCKISGKNPKGIFYITCKKLVQYCTRRDYCKLCKYVPRELSNLFNKLIVWRQSQSEAIFVKFIGSLSANFGRQKLAIIL